MLSTNEPKMKFACAKCDKSYASKRALVNHNEKVPFCNVVETQMETDNKYESLVKKVDILTEKVDTLTEIVSNQSTQITTLLQLITDMKSHIITPVLPPVVIEQQIKTPEPLSFIVPTEQPKTPEPLSLIVPTEQPKTNDLTEEEQYIKRHNNLDALDIRRIKKNGLTKYLATEDAILREQAERLELDSIERDRDLSLLVQSQQEKTNEPLLSIVVVEQQIKTKKTKKV